MNEELREYQRKLVNEKNEIILDLIDVRSARSLKDSEVDDIIEKRLSPIAKEYRKKIEEGLRTGYLKLAADKIRSAFVSANEEKDDDENYNADEWIALKKKEIANLIIEIEVELEIANVKKGQKHSKDDFIENSFNSGIKKILTDLQKRKRRSVPDAPKYVIFQDYVLDERKKFFLDWDVSVDKNKELINVSKMTLRELADYILEKELVFWTGGHDQWTDENDRNVVEAMMQRLWKDKHKISGVTDEAVESGSGEAGEFEKNSRGEILHYADLEVREIVSDLQILALFGTLNEKNKERTDGGVAEGKIDELQGRLSELQVSRERLNETTFAHPRYGLILYEMMRRMKDQPTLRKGAVPVLNEGFLPPGFGRTPIHDRVVQRNGEKLLLLGDRFTPEFDVDGNITGYNVDEYTPTEAGDVILYDYDPDPTKKGKPVTRITDDRVVKKRNGMDTLLVGDRLNKIIGENGKEIGYRWHDADAEEPGDEELYRYDPNFCYETLASDNGKDILKQYAAYLVKLIEEQRVEEQEAATAGRALNQSKIHFKELVGQRFPDPNDKRLGKSDIDRLQMYSRFLFFSFPFLTNILAVRQEKTQTPAHGFGNKDLPFIFLFDMPGFISHKSQRYANADTAYYYMLKFFPKFREGTIGAGGEAKRLNAARELVIKYDKVYSDGDENIAVVPKLPFGSSVFHTALSMVALASGDTSTLTGKAELYDGTVLGGSPTNPIYLSLGGKIAPKKQEPFNYGLVYTSLKAWDAFFTRILEDLPSNLSVEHIAEGGGKNKSLISEAYGTNIGQIKMSSTHTREKDQLPHLKDFNHLKLTANVLWDFVKRIFQEYGATSIEARIKLYEEIEKGFRHTAEVGGLSSGDAAYVLEEVLKRMSEPDKDGKLFGARNGGFAGMNPCLKYQETSVTGKRGKQLFEYVEALWNYKHMDAEGHVSRPFPFKLIGESKEVGRLIFNKEILRQAWDPDPEIRIYQEMLYGKVSDKKGGFVEGPVPAPFERVHLEKHDD